MSLGTTASRKGVCEVQGSRQCLVVALGDVDREPKPMGDDRSPEELADLIRGAEPDGLPEYLFTPSDRPLLRGSTVPAVATALTTTSSGLIVPAEFAGPQPIDFVRVYMTLRDYMPTERIDDGHRAAIEALASAGTFRQRITDLAGVSHFDLADELDALARRFGDSLDDPLKGRYRSALGASEPRRLVSRQGLLLAMREVLLRWNEANVEAPWSVEHAILLVHVLSDLLYDTPQDSSKLGPVDASLASEVIRGEILYRSDDTMTLFARSFVLWTDAAVRVEREPLPRSVDQILKDATGLSPLQWMTFGFLVWAHRNSNKPPGPIWIPVSYFRQVESPEVDTFLSAVSSDPESLAVDLADSAGSWAFLPFQRTPVLRYEGDYLVLDERFLVERTTYGLYWDAHDFERGAGADRGDAWTRVFGEMFEIYVLDIAKRLAPPLLGGGSAFHSESDLRAITSGKICDAAVDFGSDMVLFEVVGGQVTVGTRIHGEINRIEDDAQKLVIKKTRQLDEAITALSDNEEQLTGVPMPVGRRYHPVVINLGTFPVNPVTMAFVSERVEEEGLFQQDRCESLAVIDVSEVEMLEGWTENGGPMLPEILRAWKKSGLANSSLRNYILSQVAEDERGSLRSQAIRTAFDDLSSRSFAELFPADG